MFKINIFSEIKKHIEWERYHKRIKKMLKVQDILLSEYDNIEGLEAKSKMLIAMKTINKYTEGLLNEFDESKVIK